MEINAVLANLQPNYLLYPSSRSSISTTSAAATFLPLSSSLHTRFSNISFPFLFLLTQVLASASCRNINETNSAFKSAAVLSDSYTSEASELADIEWDYLGFGLLQTYYMYMMKCTQGGNFCKGELQRFENIELNPSAGVLNYGQGLFEGLKAYRKEGNTLLFHLEEKALRMRLRAKRMCTPSPTVEQFVEAVKEIVLANKSWVTNSHDLKHEFDLLLAFHAL
ncbi:hypothetical protein ES319_D12G088500v1 [Gossypium barbadense]|uniref:Uncharacterized protein n=2 Tax=Gossypium TaxID=3633 RepID=A0A5J5NVV5_GOSBA|nr:hypothetical protein ES319_D12G088500v1 [Gossypium barbadense]TYG40450.1 hypothetical protein ES288_D12G093800v1 [Gossypium darwinii]